MATTRATNDDEANAARRMLRPVRARTHGKLLVVGNGGRRRAIAMMLASMCAAIGLAACGTTSSSTSSKTFKGPAKGVAEAISEFQSDATSLDTGKICKELLADAVVKRLQAKGAKCESSIKTQLEEVDNFSVTVESISVSGSSATAKVKSTVYGKEKPGTITLAKEKGSWLVSDLGLS